MTLNLIYSLQCMFILGLILDTLNFDIITYKLRIDLSLNNNIYINKFNIFDDEDDTGIPELFDENNHKTIDIPENLDNEPDYTGISELFEEKYYEDPDYTGIPELFDENNHKTIEIPEKFYDDTDYTGIPELFKMTHDVEESLSQSPDESIMLPVNIIPVHDISVPETNPRALTMRFYEKRDTGWLEFDEQTIIEMRVPLPDGSTVRVLADGPVVLPPFWPDVCEISDHIHYPCNVTPSVEIIDHFCENGYVYIDGVGFIPDVLSLSDHVMSSLPVIMNFFINNIHI